MSLLIPGKCSVFTIPPTNLILSSNEPYTLLPIIIPIFR